MMARAFLIVMDSVGCGGAPDAADFGDAGANTLGHIAAACAAGRAEDGRSGPAADAGAGRGWALARRSGWPRAQRRRGWTRCPQGRWGAATEVSRGKDTPSGHWELAGVPVPWDWTYFPDTVPAFPDRIWWPRSAGWRGPTASSATAMPRACRSSTSIGAEHHADRLADLLHLGR